MLVPPTQPNFSKLASVQHSTGATMSSILKHLMKHGSLKAPVILATRETKPTGELSLLTGILNFPCLAKLTRVCKMQNVLLEVSFDEAWWERIALYCIGESNLARLF